MTQKPFLAITLFIAMTALCPQGLLSQTSKRDLRASHETAQRIRQQPEVFYWGTGQGGTQEEAERAAIGGLSSQIWTGVSSSVVSVVTDELQGGTLASEGSTMQQQEARTGGILTNTRRIVLAEAPQWSVMCYVEKREVREMFRRREVRIRDEFLKEAREAEATGRLDNALRSYYWAYCLLQSMQTPGEVLVPTGVLQYEPATRYITRQMEALLDSISLNAVAADDSTANLIATYRGKPVTSLRITVEQKNGSQAIDIKDGVGQVSLGNVADGNLRLGIEYEFADRSRRDREVEMAVQLGHRSGSVFSGTHKIIALGDKAVKRKVERQIDEAVRQNSLAGEARQAKGHAAYASAIKKLRRAIESRSYGAPEVRQLFTAEGYEMFRKLVVSGNVRLLPQPELRFYEAPWGRIVCRSMPLSFSHGNNHITFTEEVTFTFDTEGKIETMAFALDNDTRQAIFDSPAQWSDSVRMSIATFLENYKTAFALKRLGYVESIFDEHAIIVIGTVTLRAASQGDHPARLKENVRYTTLDKDQYIKNLKRSFASNEFINLRFTDVTLGQLGIGDNLFALRIKQDYFSSSYADSGYLFLMVDMSNAERPLIKVRTWQPQPDPDRFNGHLPEDSPYYGLLYEANFDY